LEFRYQNFQLGRFFPGSTEYLAWIRCESADGGANGPLRSNVTTSLTLVVFPTERS